MSQKPQANTEEEKNKRQRKKKSKTIITRAVTHIRLIEANPGKLDALDQLATTFMALCQQYVTCFCEAEISPDGYADPWIVTNVSQRYQRVAMQQAAGIAKSWRTNRQAAYDACVDDLADYAEAKKKAEENGIPLDAKRKEPEIGRAHV